MIETLQEILHGVLERLRYQAITYLPPLLAALIILLGAYLSAILARRLLNRIFKGIAVDRFLRRSGLAFMLDRSGRLRATRIASETAYWLILVAGFLTGLSVFDTTLTSQMTESFIFLLPKLVVAGLILLAGVWLSQYLGRGMLVWAVNEGVQSSRKLAAAPTHRHGNHAGRVARVVHRRQQVVVRGAVRLDEQDVGPRRDRVGPLHIQGDFRSPARVRLGQPARAAGLTYLGEDGVGEVERLGELFQVAGDVRIVVGVDDGDRRAAAVPGDLVEPVGAADFSRGVARRPRRRPSAGTRWSRPPRPRCWPPGASGACSLSGPPRLPGKPCAKQSDPHRAWCPRSLRTIGFRPRSAGRLSRFPWSRRRG